MNGTLFDAPAGLVTIDAQGIVVGLDGEAEQVLGLKSEEARGRSIAELLIPQALESAHWISARRPAAADPGPRFRRSAPAPTGTGDAPQSHVELTIGRIGEKQVRFLASGPEGGDPDVELALEALLEHAEELAQIGSWDWHLDTNQMSWSGSLYRIFGVEPGEIVPTDEYLFDQVHPDDRERVEKAVGSARRDGLLLPLEYRIVRPDGAVRHLRATPAVMDQAPGGVRRIVGSVQDVTDRRYADRTISAHLGVAEALSEWRTLEQGATGLLRDLALALDCVAGVLWVPAADVLVAQVVWRSGTREVSELESVIPQLRLPRGIGLAGEVWQSGEPRNVLSLADDPRYPANAVAGLSGAVALPATHGQEVLAVLELHLSEPVGGDAADRLLRSLTSIGHEVGEFLAHHRGHLKPSSLTPRELEVLQLAAQGHGGREIAERLVVSHATVRTHFEHIYEKYGVSDRASAVAKALREGAIN